MNKRLISLAAALAMLAAAPAAGAQAALTDFAPALDMALLEDYEAFALNKDTGDWTYTGNEALAALDAVANEYVRGYTGTGTLFFDVTLSGNALQNTALPTLNIYMIGSTELNAHAVSMLINGTRYDFEVTSTLTDVGGYRAELMSAPLDGDGVAMLKSLDGAASVDVLLHGEKKFYNTTIEIKDAYDNERDEIQAASITCSLAALEKYTALGAGGSTDGLIATWEDASLLKSGCTVNAMADMPATEIKLSGDFKMLKPGDASTAVKKLQQLMIDSGYMYGSANGKYNQQTRAAVLRLQAQFGLTRTGSADAMLIAMLEAGETEGIKAETVVTYAQEDAEGEVAADAGMRYMIADRALVHIDSYRFAPQLLPSAGESTAAVRAGNTDNTLIIFEGGIQNFSAESMDVYWDNKATITLDGKYTYECTLAVEQNGGTSFGTALLPLGQGRLVAYAEVPAELADNAGTWTLALTFGETVLTYAGE